MKEIKIILVSGGTVTAKDIQDYDLVGVVTDDSLPTVQIIKNTLNDLGGKIPLSLWNMLEEEVKEINSESKPETQTVEGSYEEGLNSLLNAFGEVFSDVVEVVSDTVDTITATDEYKSTKSKIKTKVGGAIGVVGFKLKIEKLKALKKMAIDEDVATKKFIAKVDLKLENLIKIQKLFS